MRGTQDDAARRRPPVSDRRRLFDAEEAWIERQLAKAPPLDDAARRHIEQLLALPPDQPNAVRGEKRAS